MSAPCRPHPPSSDSLEAPGACHPTDNDNDSDPKSKRTPLPMLPLVVVLLIQFAEPVTATVIYPFINKFVRDTGIMGGDEQKTGYYAGVIESLFFLAESLTVYHWGCASDRFGRKPILLLGPIGLSLAMVAFGLSSNFWMLVASRCLQGISNGNIGVSKTVIAEVTDATNIADAYALLPAVWSVGAALGPTIGGILSEPALRWPASLGRLPLFQQYPYFLPCAVSAMIALISVPIGIVGLKETAPFPIPREKQKSHMRSRRCNCLPCSSMTLLSHEGSHIDYGTCQGALERHTISDTSPLLPHSQNIPRSAVLSPLILSVCGIRSFTDMCITVLRPLVWSTSITSGGLGFGPYRIGLVMGIWGLVNIIFQVTLLGPMIRRVGAKNMVSFAFIGYMISFMLYPLLLFFVQSAGMVDTRAWAILLIQLALSMLCNGAYAGFQVIVVENTSKNSLGAANGLVQAATSGTEAFAPTIVSSLFSFSLERRLSGGNFVFYLLMAISLAGVHLVSRLRTPPPVVNERCRGLT